MKIKLKLLTLLFFLTLFTVESIAQSHVVKGKVVDEQGLAIPGQSYRVDALTIEPLVDDARGPVHRTLP